jgi:hypothetical protein
MVGVTGPTHSELIVLTGLMIVRMYEKAYLEHEVFPVCPLSFLGKVSSINI